MTKISKERATKSTAKLFQLLSRKEVGACYYYSMQMQGIPTPKGILTTDQKAVYVNIPEMIAVAKHSRVGPW